MNDKQEDHREGIQHAVDFNRARAKDAADGYGWWHADTQHDAERDDLGGEG